MAKMGEAVLIGSAISQLLPILVVSVTTINFFVIAVAISPKAEKHETEKQYPASRDALASFAAVSFTEWGYLGQITAITMSARSASRSSSGTSQ